MSKQSEAKASQGYRDAPNCCQNCQNFTKDVVDKQYRAFSGLQTWTEDKNLRCSIGAFKVNKMSVCDLFEIKDPA